MAVYSDCKVWETCMPEIAALSREHPGVALALRLGAVLASRLRDVNKRLAAT